MAPRLASPEADLQDLVQALERPDADLESEDPWPRKTSLHREALWALARLGRRAEAIPALEAYLQAGTPHAWLARSVIGSAGGNFAANLPSGMDAGAREKLELLCSLDSKTCEAALESIETCGRTCSSLYPALMEALFDPSFGDPAHHQPPLEIVVMGSHTASIKTRIPAVLVAVAPDAADIVSVLETRLQGADEDLFTATALALSSLGPPARRTLSRILAELEASQVAADADPEGRRGRRGRYRDPRVRLVRAAAKFGTGEPGVTEALLRAVRSKVNDYREEALAALGEMPADTETIRILIEALGDEHFSSAHNDAKKILGKFGDLADRELLKALGHSSSGVRAGVVETLGQFGDPNVAAPAIIELLADADDGVREQALGTLWYHHELWEPEAAVERGLHLLIEALGDPDAGIRWKAAQILMGLEHRARDGVSGLLELLRREAPVREKAAAVLSKVGRGSPEAIAALAELLGDETQVESEGDAHSIGETALNGLGWLQPESFPYIQKALDHADSKVRANAALALAAAREEEATLVRSRAQKPPPARHDFERLFESLGNNVQGHPEYRHRATGIVFVGLPGGVFDMGSSGDDPAGRDPERPRQRVSLAPFLLAKYELTWDTWRRFMKVDDSERPWKAEWNSFPAETYDGSCDPGGNALLFCELTGLLLPTEAQWEYTCRAGTEGPYAGPIDGLAWHEGNAEGGKHRPGEKAPNAFGLHDMHGNVWEWVRDGGSYDFPCRPGDGFRLAPQETRQVFRGGSYEDPPAELRSSRRRSFYGGDDFGRSIGLRPAFYPLP